MNEKTKTTNISHIIVYVIVLILFFIVLYNIRLRSKYSIQYEWWNTYDGKNYDNFLNLTNMLLSRENTLLYYITKFFDSNLYNSLTAPQIDFLFNYVMPFIYMKLEKGTQGFVLPRHLTRNITFQDGDNINFENWRTKDPNHIKSTEMYISYDEKGNPVANNNGIYPSPSDSPGWKWKFNEWMGITPDNKDFWTTDENQMLVPNLTDETLKVWFDTDTHADNFLAMYGILPNSPLCLSFINGYYNSGSLKLDKQSFLKLVGGSTGGTEGGWIGYLQGLGSNDYDRYANFMLSSYNYKKPKSPPDQSNKCAVKNQLAGYGTALGQAAGIGGFALLVPVAEGAATFLGFTPVGWIFMAVGAAVAITQSPLVKDGCV